MKFDYYLFDLDGTLLDLGNIGDYSDQILVETLLNLGVKKVPDKMERMELWQSGRQFQEILKNWGISKSDNFWECYDKTDFKNRKILLRRNQISLFKDVRKVLELIYNHKDDKKLAICTNTA
ncbi:MAG: HAD hydrolase-like protein, partial [Candidatus Odinarchaeota archaeon]